MQFHKKLKESRENAGYSQQELADIVGSKKQNIAAYEQGRAQPGNELLVKISKACNVTVEWLTGIEDEGGPKSVAKDKSYTYWESRQGHFTEQEKKDLDKFIKELLAEADETNRKSAMDVARVILKQGKKKKEK